VVDQSVTNPAGLQSTGQRWLSLIRRDPVILLGVLVLAVFAVIAIVGKILIASHSAFDPATVRLADKLLPPLSRVSDAVAADLLPPFGYYLLGTDDLGRDVFSRMLQGTSVSLTIGFLAMGIATLVGVVVGALAGYHGERRLGPLTVDSVLMRLTDLFLSFPSFFLILTVVALLPPSIYNIMIVIGLTSWMGTARFVRASFMSMKHREFVDAARALGLPGWRIMLVHMLPNALGPVLVTATIGVAGAILTESALSFLGFGVQPPNATWGNILADGRNFIFDAPWLFLVPGIAVILVVLAFNFVGEGLREAINPRLSRD